MHKSHTRLTGLEKIKQLIFIVSEQWVGKDFQVNGYNVKVNSQNNPSAQIP